MTNYYDKVMKNLSKITWREGNNDGDYCWKGIYGDITIHFYPAKPTFKFLFISIKRDGNMVIYFNKVTITETVTYDKSVVLDSAIMELKVREYVNDKTRLDIMLG